MTRKVKKTYQERDIVFQIPATSDLHEESLALNERLNFFNRDLGRRERVLLFGHIVYMNPDDDVIRNTTGEHFNDLEQDATVILADSRYSSKDFAGSIHLLSPSSAPVYVFCDPEANSFVKPLGTFLKNRPNANPESVYFRFYPGTNYDPEYFFSGFKNLAEAFGNEMSGSAIRKAFLGHRALSSIERKVLCGGHK